MNEPLRVFSMIMGQHSSMGDLADKIVSPRTSDTDSPDADGDWTLCPVRPRSNMILG